MAPWKPLFPIPISRPFHDVDGGSHTSKLILESVVGVATAVTRQCDASVTACVIFTFDRVRVVRFSQAVAASARSLTTETQSHRENRQRLFLIRISAHEVCGIVSATGTLPSRNLRIGTERSRSIDDCTRAVGCNDLARRNPFLHPLFEGAQYVVGIWSRPTAAVSHSRSHEESEELFRFFRTTHFPGCRFVILEHIVRYRDGVGPAGVHQQLSTALLESGEIRIYGAHESQFGIGVCDVTVPIHCPPIPIRIIEQEIAIHANSHRFGRIQNKPAPACIRTVSECFATRRPTWIN